jgi:hypothetical protein
MVKMLFSNKNVIEIDKTWTSVEEIHAGILVYRNILNEDMKIIDNLEKLISKNEHNFAWKEALVGYGQKMPGYRDCYDFKYKNIEGNTVADFLKDFDSSYRKSYYSQLQAIKDYCQKHNVGEMRYWEATNFVKYGLNQHFQSHVDHGFSYNCTVSLVAYPNDNYDGGELEFTLQKIKIKPQAGDLYIFPSNFMYPHRACPVTSGIKYSLVTMLDYSEKYHDQKFYQETGR